MVSPVLSQLRSATSTEHSALEGVVSIEKRVAQPDGYPSLLPAFYGFYQPVESILTRYSWDPELDFEGRRKTAWLEEDLEASGQNPAEVQLCAGLPSVDTLPRAWGCLYVLEGATLGGQHISRMLDSEGIDPEETHFFHSYGPKVGERWKSFLALLDTYASRNGSTGDIVAGAVDTFASFRQWLQKNLTPI